MKKTYLLIGLMAATLMAAGCGETGKTTETAAVESVAETAATETAAETAAETFATETAMESETETETEEVWEGSLKDLAADYFTLGVGINGSTPDNQTLNIPQYMELSAKHFNSCTMTNLMKSGYILDQPGSQKSLAEGDGAPALAFYSIDPTLQWCKENGMKMRGHTLVWHTQAPDWFFKEGYSSEGEFVDKETMLFRMESYIKQLLTHVQTEYPGVIYCWDVVNEAVDPESADPDSFFQCRTMCGEDVNPWYATIGPDYVEMAFTYARKYADPEVKLFYNDYNTFQSPKIDGIYSLVESLKEKGLVDGIGMQGYWGMDWPGEATIRAAIERYATLGLEIQITELSVGVDSETEAQFKKQASTYGWIFKMLCEEDEAGGGPANITNVTLFGLVDHYRKGDTTNSRIFDENYEPKPAFYAIKEAMEAAEKN